MSIKPRTIDNLGIETSSRYARDKAQLDTKLLEESRFIPDKASVSVVKPYLSTEFELYLAPDKLQSWASFAPPPEYFTNPRPLFSYQLVPSLGGYEKQEADEDKLEALEDALSKSFKEGHKNNQEKQQERTEVKAILLLLKTLSLLDRALGIINSRRNQYQKG